MAIKRTKRTPTILSILSPSLHGFSSINRSPITSLSVYYSIQKPTCKGRLTLRVSECWSRSQLLTRLEILFLIVEIEKSHRDEVAPAEALSMAQHDVTAEAGEQGRGIVRPDLSSLLELHDVMADRR